MLNRARQIALTLLLLTFSIPAAGATVTVAWDANPEPEVVGYIVHWGTESGRYSWSRQVTGTQCIIDGLEEGRTYYFALQAVSSGGLTSPFSEEASTTITGRPTLVTFSSDVRAPATVGLPMTWSATSRGGSGEVEYKFFLYSRATGEWSTLREWAPESEISWTPRESGVYALQVWIRTVGSSATYEDWRSTGYFAVGGDPQVTELKVEPAGVVRVGFPVVLTASVAGGEAPFEYQFWVFDKATGRWSALGDYGASNQAMFTPARVGHYSVQVWVRSHGSNARYDAWTSAGPIQASTQVVVQSLTPNVQAPVATGTPITWTAVAGGAANVEYKFWAMRAEAPGWVVLRDWAPEAEIEWAPEVAGTYNLQVWAREVGSAADYAAWKGAGPYTVTEWDGKLAVYALGADRDFPATVGTPIVFEALSIGGVQPEYEFWLYNGNTRSWERARPYSTSPRWSWTPSVSGTYAVQVWARSAGSAERYEAWKGTDYFQINPVTVSLSSLTPNTGFPVTRGTRVTWTAIGSANNGAPLEYQYWVQEPGGMWTTLQSWGAANSASWTPTRAGIYHLQVWARVQGSSARYEAWLGTKDLVVR